MSRERIVAVGEPLVSANLFSSTGGIRTHTGPILSRLPLPLGYSAEDLISRDLRRRPTRLPTRLRRWDGGSRGDQRPSGWNLRNRPSQWCRHGGQRQR